MSRVENEYLELANHAKEKYEEQQKVIEKMKKRIMEARKIIMVSYSTIRMIDNYMMDILEDGQYGRNGLKLLLEMARNEISEWFDEDVKDTAIIVTQPIDFSPDNIDGSSSSETPSTPRDD